jgi:hypothetical protein
MGEEEKKNQSGLVSSANRGLATRSSGLVKRGLELLSSQQERVIYFPTDRSIGVLTVVGDKLTKIDACGKVTIPVAKRLGFNGTPTAGLSHQDSLLYNILGDKENRNIIEITDSDLLYLKKLHDLKWLNLISSSCRPY